MSTVLSYIDQTKKLDNKQYRLWFRAERIPQQYRPWMHVMFNGGVLLSLSLFSLLMIQSWNLTVLIIFALSLVLGNFFVWAVHRYPLHRRYKYWTFPYDTHTVVHHRYFTADSITYDDSKDLYAIFFPISAVAGFAFLAQPALYFSVRYFFGSDLAFPLMASTSLYFLLYEFVHWASHLPTDHLLMKIPWLRFMRTHHLVHHNPKLMMKYNFCIVYPLMDMLLGTYYKEATLPLDDFADHYEDIKVNLPKP
jgi:hypothetical protein